MPLFDWHTTLVTPLTATPVMAFPANANRVSIIVSCSASPGVNFGLFTGDSGFTEWVQLFSPTNLTFPYRDYGPIIKQAIFIGVGTNGTPVSVTEVIQIPQRV